MKGKNAGLAEEWLLTIKENVGLAEDLMSTEKNTSNVSSK